LSSWSTETICIFSTYSLVIEQHLATLNRHLYWKKGNQGRKEGRNEGRKKGRKEGRKERRKEGRLWKKGGGLREIVKRDCFSIIWRHCFDQFACGKPSVVLVSLFYREGN
jgi:hypothetical protein